MAAGTVTRKQAEAFWNKYNTDGNETLTVEEVQKALKEACEENDDADVRAQYVFFGQDEPKDMNKEEFIKGMMRTQKSQLLIKQFKEMDTDGNKTLSKDELEKGLVQQGFTKEVADIIVEELEFDDDGKYNIQEFIETVAFSEHFSKSYDF